jgi:hypothetical protein
MTFPSGPDLRAYIETNITGLYALPQKPRDRGVVILTQPMSLSWINAIGDAVDDPWNPPILA